jgi:hypothetical protein
MAEDNAERDCALIAFIRPSHHEHHFFPYFVDQAGSLRVRVWIIDPWHIFEPNGIGWILDAKQPQLPQDPSLVTSPGVCLRSAISQLQGMSRPEKLFPIQSIHVVDLSAGLWTFNAPCLAAEARQFERLLDQVLAKHRRQRQRATITPELERYANVGPVRLQYSEISL